jgi:dCMP deaminase
MIVGITGTKASGKGIVAEILKEKGFFYVSTSDQVRKEAISKGISNYTISDLQDIGNEIRKNFGSEELVKRCLKETEGKENIVIDGIRNPGEVQEIKKVGGIMVGVDAPVELRFERLLSRKRESDPKTLDDFKKMEARDRGDKESEVGQQVDKCLELSDHILVNDSTLETLKTKVEYILLKEKTKENPKRPTWDEYFIKIAALVGERSTCLRHKVGAVIVKDKRLLSTGYNGAVKSVKDCIEKGCLRDELKIPSGTRHEICRAVHAEQNAIIQAAFYGVDTRNAIMYCTHTPCMICAKMMINAGIKEIVTYNNYPDANALELLKEADIDLRIIKRPEAFINFKD